MVQFAVLNVGQCGFQFHEQWIDLFHGGYQQIVAHVIDSFDGADNARSSGAEHLQHLHKTQKTEANQLKFNSNVEIWLSAHMQCAW